MGSGRQQHNDEPSDDGTLLGRNAFITALAEQIAECTPPLVFGVHGEWGAGKTSVLRQLQHHLSDPEIKRTDLKKKQKEAQDAQRPKPSHYADTVFTIWFEAWRYQHEPIPLIALLQEMKRQFGLAMKAKEALKAGSTIALKALTNGFDTVAGLIGGESIKLFNPSHIEKAAEAYDKANYREALPTDSVREFLQGAINELLKGLDRKENARLVIFIDDLDRCSPESAYRLLEGLKIHLNLPNCVFVLGMNQGAVVEQLAPYFSKSNDEVGERRAESYLEKLCANIWRLPPVRDPLGVLRHWLYTEPLTDKDTAFGQKVLQNGMNSLSNETVIQRSLPPNPRKLKALANTLLKLWIAGAGAELKKANTPPLLFECFLFLAYVYQFHQDVYQRWVLDPDFYLTLQDWANERALHDRRKDIFKNLRLTASPQAATAAGEKEAPSSLQTQAALSLFPEPGLHGQFWMTPWLLAVDGGQSAKPDDFKLLLNVFA